MVYSDFIHEVEASHIKAVTLRGAVLMSVDDLDYRAQVYLPSDDPGLLPRLLAKDIRIAVQPEAEDADALLRFVLSWPPYFVAMAIWVIFLARLTWSFTGLTKLASLQARDHRRSRTTPVSYPAAPP